MSQTCEFYQNMYAAFTGLRHEIHEQFVESDKVLTRWTATGEQIGEFFGHPPSNQTVSFDGINIYTFAGDKLVESHVSWDLRGLERRDPR